MMTISIALGLAIGLSLGILFGSMADDIVRGMTIGVPPADAAARLRCAERQEEGDKR